MKRYLSKPCCENPKYLPCGAPAVPFSDEEKKKEIKKEKKPRKKDGKNPSS